jgi:hypothetical protein
VTDATQHAQRLERWSQTPSTRIPDPQAAAAFIDRVGIATLFPVSSEIPNLFHAYVGDPTATTSSTWDSPSGHVYSWRWALGRQEAAFYSALVRKRPTWVSWTLLPAILRVRGELRVPDELYHRGELSAHAYRIAQVLEESGGVLSTGEVRRAAGFPTGKEQRAAYLKAIEELDTRLLLAKVFSPDDDDMRHALVSVRYPHQLAVAEEMTRDEALDRFLRAYLPNAIYVEPPLLAKHLMIPEAELRASLARVVAADLATIEGVRYVWTEGRASGVS